MAYNLSALNVLLVEDNPHMRRLLRQILNAYGIKEIVEAEDGATAFERSKQKKADVVIVDWMMDRLNGIEFTRMVRTDEDSPDRFVPIIMLTGYTEKARVFEARDAGVTEFMAKPVSAQSLYDRIASVIEGPRRFVEVGSYFGPDRRRRINDFTGNDRRIAGLDGDDAERNKRGGASKAPDETDETPANELRGVRDQVGSLLHEGS